MALSDPDGLVRFFVVDERQADDLAPNYNVAPTQDVHAVAEHDGRRHLVLFRWGLVPAWASDLSVGARMINARAETLAEKPAFRPSLEGRRCLIPAAGFYEWERTPERKVPHLITREDGDPLAFAGLWSSWRDGDRRLLTCTIVTTAAQGPITRLHDRMPVVLPREAWGPWLSRASGPDEALAVLRDAAPPPLTFHPVSTRVNDHRNNGPELVEPVAV